MTAVDLNSATGSFVLSFFLSCEVSVRPGETSRDQTVSHLRGKTVPSSRVRQDRGRSFSNTDRPRPVNDIFFSAIKQSRSLATNHAASPPALEPTRLQARFSELGPLSH